MITPYNWLKSYVELDVPPEEFRVKMAHAGNAVESMIDPGAGVENVVVGRVTDVSRHPDAERLHVCQVDVGGRTVQVVCGADNVFEGAFVPVALPGAALPGGRRIEKGRLRGVDSMGMLCSGEELGLTEDDYPGAGVYGILILADAAQPGTDIRSALGWDEPLFEFEVGANRPDCLSVIGLAREAAAVFGKPLRLPATDYAESGGDISRLVGVEVRDAALCPRYMAAAVRNVKIAPSPQWMQARLKAAGVRPISNIVDITNFVMLETGQPMHAFDLEDIRGGRIVVRRAAKGERMTTLDGKERELDENMLLICDSERAIGIAGVMGGENSEIKERTATVVFEAAKFTYANIRRTSRALGLLTESALRFSKGVETGNVKTAMDRALHLVQELGAGEIVGGCIDVLSETVEQRRISVSAPRINAYLGTDIPATEMARLLNRLQIGTTTDGDTLHCDIPPFRGDIEQSADIAEEVARLYGYDNIPLRKMKGDIVRGRVTPVEAMRDRLRAMLCNAGFYECVTYSFGSPSAFDKLMLPQDDPLREAIRLVNPLGDDRSVMRTMAAADMLAVVSANLSKKTRDMRLFETGKLYRPRSLPLTELPDEPPYLCMAVCGKGEDFYTLKGEVENILWRLNIRDVEYRAEGRPYYHPGRKASVYAGGRYIGEMGEVHPVAAANFDIGERVYLSELRIGPLMDAADDLRAYRPLPRFPGMARDLAFTVDKGVTAGGMLRRIRQAGGKNLVRAEVFDVYEGAQVGAGRKSLAFSLFFQAEDRTLTDGETAEAVERIIAAVSEGFGAELRK